MFLIDLLLVFIFALVLSSILGWGVGWRHPSRSDGTGVSIFFLFIILFFAMWAGGVWMVPHGPLIYGRPWLSLLIIGIFISLILLAVAAPGRRRPRTPEQAEQDAVENVTAVTVFGIFFWILIIGFLIAAIVSYFI